MVKSPRVENSPITQKSPPKKNTKSPPPPQTKPKQKKKKTKKNKTPVFYSLTNGIGWKSLHCQVDLSHQQSGINLLQ